MADHDASESDLPGIDIESDDGDEGDGDGEDSAMEEAPTGRGIPVHGPAVCPADGPTGKPVGRAVGLPSEASSDGPAAHPAGDDTAWGLWWGTFGHAPGCQIHVWRCSPGGLNQGEPLIVMTAADAQRYRLDQAHRFGLPPVSFWAGPLPAGAPHPGRRPVGTTSAASCRARLG